MSSLFYAFPYGADTLLVGTLLNGRYRVLKNLGKGGEAELFVAWDEDLERRVAVKFQHPRSFEPTSWFLHNGKRIEKEYVRLEKVLDVRGIPRVLDEGHLDGGHGRRYLVMEFVDGVTVKSWIAAHQPVPSAAAVSLVAQLCEILVGLHASGYVHRDVTPTNTMVQPDGQVRLLDLGISIANGELNNDPCGSPGYAAPEQYDPETRLTPQVDVFALGAMLFEMVVSKLPYSGLRPPLDDTAVAFPKNFRAEMPEDLRALGLAMIAVDPRERPDGVGEVLRSLRPMLPPLGSPTSPKAARPDPTAYYRIGWSAL
ncbi:serine/threonine protein kinase [Microbispora sp. CA-135349]|uniref:serine/threonine protein kinase n=1 Tax=Microbispora sp. CA-135349 TaxID=3239953 RepID=UPI003D941BD3